MKKLIAFIAMIAIFFGIAATSVSAETYEVKKGDSLWGIAKKYDTTIEDLVEINNLRTMTIQPKQKITINDIYIVEKGDTLTDISEEFNVTVDEIKEWNNLKSHLLVIGQELEIHGVHISQEDDVENVKETTKATKEKVSKPASKTTESPEVAKSAQKASKSEEKPEGKTISVTATAYTAKCDGCSGVTYTGVDLNNNRNAKVIAVDPKVIPLGTKVYVEGYGYATAEDIGGAIKGNRIDLHVPTKEEAYSWGRQTVNVTILN